MPGDRDDEICRKALELLSDLCSRGEVPNENCLDFTYYFRDLARPRYSDSGEETGLHAYYPGCIEMMWKSYAYESKQ